MSDTSECHDNAIFPSDQAHGEGMGREKGSSRFGSQPCNYDGHILKNLCLFRVFFVSVSFVALNEAKFESIQIYFLPTLRTVKAAFGI
jgi:hypothetical protein